MATGTKKKVTHSVLTRAGSAGFTRWFIIRLGLAAGLLAMAAAVIACGGDDGVAQATQQTPAQASTTRQTASTTEPQSPPATDPAAATAPADGGIVVVPPSVQQTHDAILGAARAFDYEALEGLVDPATFSYSFGEEGDPIGYWRLLEEEGEVPILGDFLGVVLSMQAGMQDGVYVWPAAYAKSPSEWTAVDLADMRMLYTDEEISGFKQAGGYLGYRVGIQEDGTWIFFVAGD